MAEFVKVVTEKNRMCEANKCCSSCPLSAKSRGTDITCSTFLKESPEEAEEIILRWAAEHPFKSNGTKFCEVFGVPFWAISCGVTPEISKWIRSEYKEAKK